MATLIPFGIAGSAIAAYAGFGMVRATGGTGGASTRITPIGVGETERAWLDDSDGRAMAWITEYVAAPFTLAGTVTCAVRARESSTAVNIGLRIKLIKIPYDGADGIVVIGTFSRSGEITASFADYSWTGTPTSTLVKKNDRLLIQGFFIAQGGTSAAGTGEIENDTNTGVTLTEDVTFTSTAVVAPVPPIYRNRRLLERSIRS